MKFSDNVIDEVFQAVEGSPVVAAHLEGVLDTAKILENWKGDVAPPSPNPVNPYSWKNQDALARAYKSGVLLGQAIKIEELLKEFANEQKN